MLAALDVGLLSTASTQEGLIADVAPDHDLQQYRSLYRPPPANRRQLSEDAITIPPVEKEALNDMNRSIFAYMLSRREGDITGVRGWKDTALQTSTAAETSIIKILGVIPESATNHDSLRAIVGSIHDL